MAPLDHSPTPVVCRRLRPVLRVGVDFRFFRPGNIRFDFRLRRYWVRAMTRPIRTVPE
jgi:hypothetical protein